MNHNLDCYIPIEDAKPGFYGEWAFYDNEDEKQEAIQYLNLWKKVFLKKIQKKIKEEYPLIFRNELVGCKGKNTIGIKIQIE